jgi:gliding motility-associated-like protein
MKRLLLLLILSILISPQFIQSQSVMVACGSPVTTLTQCGGTFADPGGTGNYPDGCTVTETICAGTAGQCVTLQFTEFNLENTYDYLRIYNGPTSGSPLLATLTGTTIPGNITSTSGCLTLVFTSDGIISAPGWLANVICAPCGTPPPPPPGPIVASDCSGAVNICTNASFQIDPSGSGSVVEFTTGSNISNPLVNPASGNDGCMLSGELNSTWMIVNIATTGTLEFSFGADGGSNCLDWIMWPYAGPTACNNIINNTLAPVRCNYNFPCESYTGIGTPVPAGGEAGNFEPELNVTCGQKFLICLSNYSSASTPLPLNFTGTASISCSTFTPITVNNATICPGTNATLTAAGGLTYSWAPGGQTTSSITVSPATTTTYTVTGNGACGSGTATATVTVLPASDPSCGCTATANNTGPYCVGGTIQLNGTGGGTYSWSGPNGFTSTLQNPTLPATAAAAGVYTLTTNLSGCVATATTTVVINPVATANANIDQTLCAGGSITLAGLVGGGAASGTWSAPTGTFSSVTNLASTYTPAITSGTVTLTLTSNDPAGPCPSVLDQMIVTVNPIPTVVAGAPQTVCAGTAVTLSATGATTYSWDNGITQGVAFTPAATTTYTVTGTSLGCTNTSTVTVTVNPIPVVNAGPDVSICTGGSTTLTATGATAYSWAPGGMTTAAITVSPLATTTYTVTGTALGCTSTDAVTVSVLANAPINAGPDVSICIGASTVLTGTGGVTYTWNNGLGNGNNFTVSPVVTTTYSVTGTNASGCVGTDVITVTVNPLPTVVAGAPQTVCAGTPVTLTATGATTYSWDNGITQGVAFTPASTTTYTVTGTSAAGCINTSTVTVTVNPLPTVVAGTPQTVCIGASVTLTASGASTYTWDNGVIQGVAFTPAATTTYTVTGTSAAGCINTSNVNVTVNPLPTVLAGSPQSICIGASVTLTASGASSYTWDNGITQGVAFTPVATTTYTVTGTSAAGCISTDQVLVTINPLPTIIAGAPQTICIGSSVTLTASGGSTYSWNNGITQGVAFTPAATTTYTVTGTSAAGCINTSNVIVTVNPLPIVDAGLDQTICIGLNATLTGTGASTYSWNNGVTQGVSFLPVATATYTVSGTDANGCVNTDQVVVTVDPLPIVDAGPDQAACSGTAVILSGSGASSYTWDNGVLNGVAFTPAIGAVTYTVTGTSAAGCINTDQVLVTVNPNPAPIINGPTDYCIGNPALLSTSVPFTTYNWSTAVSTATTSATMANNPITVTVTNIFGCIGTSPIFIVNENSIITSNSTQTICQGQSVLIHGVAQSVAGLYSQTFNTAGCDSVSNVTLVVNPLPTVNAGLDQAVCTPIATTLTAAGAATYLWDNGVTDGVPFTQAVGTTTYTVTGTDANGCINTDQVNVTVNPLPIVNAGPDQAICIGASATVAGSGALSYTWNNGVTDNVAFTPALTNTYTVTGTDINGCLNTDQVIVTVNPLPTVGAGPDQIICVGATVTLSGSGASTYSWDNAVINGIAFSPPTTATYTVTGTDINGCINTDQVLVTVNPLPVVNAGPDQDVCQGTAVTLSGSGAATYTWNNGITNGVPFTQAVGTTTYTVTGTSVDGCVNTDQVDITVNPLPIVNAGPDQAICIGAATAIVGAGAATYTWNNGVTDNVAFTPALTNTYTVTGTDVNGCVNADQVVVTVNPLPTVVAGPDEIICIGASVTLSGSGASTYTWDNGVTNGITFSPVATTTYTVTGTDVNGCINTDQVLVTVNPLPVVNAGPDQDVCQGTVVTLSGGGASTYSWNNGAVNGTPFTQAVGTVTYTVTGTDANGCINTDQADITVNPTPVVNAGPDQIVCIGTSVTLSGSGTATYSWNNGITNNVAFTPVVGTVTYTVTGTSVEGCVTTDDVIVTVNPLPVVFAGNDVTVCDGSTVTLTGSGASIYSWNNGVLNGTPFTPSVGTTTYTVTGTSAAGCVNTDQVDVIVNPIPVVSFSPDVTSGCAPLTVNLTNTTPNSVDCLWTISNGTVLTGCGTVPVTFTQGGCYDVTLTTTSNNGCVGTLTATNLICVENDPIASFSPSSNTVTTNNTEVIFTNQSIGATSYYWTFGDATQPSTDINPTHVYPDTESGNYLVTLIAYSPLGCTETALAYINVVEELIFYVPNTFTPDDDNFNPVFQPVFTSGFDPYDFTLLIFNRWGEIIFESHDASIGWNGTYGSNGEIQMCQDGTYTWKIEFKTKLNDERKMIVGHVNLLR